MSSRHYLFPEQGDPMRLSARLVNGLVHGDASLRELSGTRQKILGVVLEMENGKPREIVHTEGSFFEFDEEGSIRRGLTEALRLGMNIAHFPAGDSAVVSITPRLDKKKLREEHRWEPTAPELDRVAADIWPKTKSDRLKPYKPAVPPRQPLTFEAKSALADISQHFNMFKLRIDMLKDRGLKSFRDETRELAETDPDFRPLNRALYEMAEWELARRAQRKSGNGTWYAIVEVMFERDGYSEAVERHTERCEGRKAAILAVRRMLAEHAQKFSEQTTVEAEMLTEMEWEQLGYAHLG